MADDPPQPPNPTFTHVVSDLHLAHVRIIIYEPMRQAWGVDSDAMTETMIQAWSNIVKPEDHVLNLGDFMLGPKVKWPEYRLRLNGQVTIVKGNHDPIKQEHWDLMAPLNIHETLTFMDPVLGVVVCRHDPHKFTPEDIAKADLLLHGHLHSNQHHLPAREEIRAKCVCVSIEQLPTAPAPMPWGQFQEWARQKLGR